MFLNELLSGFCNRLLNVFLNELLSGLCNRLLNMFLNELLSEFCNRLLREHLITTSDNTRDIHSLLVLVIKEVTDELLSLSQLIVDIK